MTRFVAFLAVAGALVAVSTWIYARVDLPVAGRGGLAALRAGALIVLAALLFDLRVPWVGRGGAEERWVLLDASASMAAGDGGAWTGASARARELEGEGWRVHAFGGGELTPGVPAGAPAGDGSALAPALRRAVEAGAGRVVVLSDMRFPDPARVETELARLAASVSFQRFGAPLRNAGVGRFHVEDQARAGAPLQAEVEIFAEEAGDSVDLVVFEEGGPAASSKVAVGPPGVATRAALSLPPPRAAGRVRFTAQVVLSGDVFPADDEAVAYATAGEEAGGIVLVSLTPDWEPRALLPVLEAATGLPGRGFLQAGPDRFVTVGRLSRMEAPWAGAAVERLAASADLLVVHGATSRHRSWTEGAARRGGATLVWPADPTGAAALGLEATRIPGPWRAVPRIPGSPLSPALGDVSFGDLPPLDAALAGPAPRFGSAPLLLRRGDGVVETPALLLSEHEGRTALILASGFWRWAARDGAPREAYRRLWSAIAGWLLAGDPGTAEVRPERDVAPEGQPLAWRVPAGEGVRLRVTDQAGATALDTLLPPGPLRAVAAPLPRGVYAYRAAVGDQAVGEGRFDVEGRSSELAFAPADPASAAGARDPVPFPSDAAGLPLRGSAVPYLLILTLLSVEWVARRRAGLR